MPATDLDLTALSTRDLLRAHGQILSTLLGRKVIRTRTAPAADLAQLLVAGSLNGELGDGGDSGWDVRLPGGRRLVVRCRVLETRAGVQDYAPFRSWDFEACIFVRFDPVTYDVLEAVEVPVQGVRRLAASTDGSASGDRVSVDSDLTGVLGAIDHTDLLRRTWDTLTDAPAGTAVAPRASVVHTLDAASVVHALDTAVPGAA